MFLEGFVLGLATALFLLGAVILYGAGSGRQQLEDFLRKGNERTAAQHRKAVAVAADIDSYRLTTELPCTLAATPPHEPTAATAMRLTMVANAVTIATLRADPDGAPLEGPPTGPAPVGRIVASLNTKALVAELADDKHILVLTPKGCDTLCEVAARAADDDDDDGPAFVAWTGLRVRFHSLREAERWATVLNATPQTGQWQHYARRLDTLQRRDFVNTFIGRLFFENTKSVALDELIRRKVTKKLKQVKLPSPLRGTLRLGRLTVGSEPPLFSKPEFLGVASTGEVRFDVDVTYAGGFTLELATAVDIKSVRLPSVVVTATINELRGRLRISIGAPPSDKMWLGFHQAPHLSLNIRQDVHTGAENRLLSAVVGAVPDLSGVVTELVRKHLFEDMLLPFLDDFPLPNVEKTPPSSPDSAPAPAPASVSPAVAPLLPPAQAAVTPKKAATPPSAPARPDAAPSSGGTSPASQPSPQAAQAAQGEEPRREPSSELTERPVEASRAEREVEAALAQASAEPKKSGKAAAVAQAAQAAKDAAPQTYEYKPRPLAAQPQW